MESTARRPATDVRDGSLSEVARCCWVIYQKAADAYGALANNAMSEEISRMWFDMAEGLKKHIMYWKRVSELVERDPTLEVLGNPYEGATVTHRPSDVGRGFIAGHQPLIGVDQWIGDGTKAACVSKNSTHVVKSCLG